MVGLRSTRSCARGRPEIELGTPSRSARAPAPGPRSGASTSAAGRPHAGGVELDGSSSRPRTLADHVDDARRRDVDGPFRAAASARSPPALAAARKPATVSATNVRSRRGSQRAEPHRLAGERLGDDRRDHRARRLVRPVGVERPQDRHRQLERAVVGVHQLVGARPCWRRTASCGSSGCSSVIGIVRAVPYTSLVEVCTTRRTPGAQRGLGDVERAEHVRLEEVARVHVRVRDGDLRAEVEDDLRALGGRRDRLHVAQVAEHDLDVAPRSPGRANRACRGRCASCSGTNARTRAPWRRGARPSGRR